MESAVAPAKVSAQSPPCSQNAAPAAASATRSFKLSHSPAKTSGGNDRSSATALATATLSGQDGCCAAVSEALNSASIWAELFPLFIGKG